MASILDRYGIKEVADVTFYEINSDGSAGKPVLYLDTLKVSTIEQTAETADARGGKGNPVLVSWDYGKEITVSIEDALFSPKSMNIMFGSAGASLTKASGTVEKTAVVTLTSEGKMPDYFTAEVYDSNSGSAKKKVYVKESGTYTDGVLIGTTGVNLISVYAEDGVALDSDMSSDVSEWAAISSATYASRKAYVKYTIPASKSTITIDGDSFPGTYYVTGDTYARSDVDGKDQFFQFIIPKAKMQAENTITLEAEGDPSVFNMNLKVLRPDDGEMMKLVQYDLVASGT